MSEGDGQRRVEQTYMRHVNVGIEFFVTIGLLTALGVWLDRRLEWFPILTIAFVLLGFVTATYHLVKSVSEDDTQSKKPNVLNGRENKKDGRQ